MLIDVSQLQYAPLPNVGSQLERATIALLKAFFQANNLPNIGTLNFYFSNDWRKRVLPLIEVLAHKSSESIPHTRNETYMVRISFEWPGANQPGQEQTNPNFNWQTLNAIIGVVMAALSQTTENTSVAASQDYNNVLIDALPKIVGKLITQAGRALAVDASGGTDQMQVQDAATNADMKNFTCDFVEYKGAQRAEGDGQGGIYIKEIRNFEMRGCPSNVD